MRADILSGRRAIVLYDQTSSGKTPATFAPHLQAYLDQIGSKAKIKKLAIGNANRRGVAIIPIDDFPDVGKYLFAPYEGVVSEFPRHVLGASPMSELKERRQYRSFKKAVLERMKRDRTLHRFIRTLNIEG
jgi:hypothetical protein